MSLIFSFEKSRSEFFSGETMKESTEAIDYSGNSDKADETKKEKDQASYDRIASIMLAAMGEEPTPEATTSVPGKRGHDVTVTTTNTTRGSMGMGIMGGMGSYGRFQHNHKRGKREWLSFRGSRESRVGDDYQVAFLPPVETDTNDNGGADKKGKGK